MKTKTKTTGNSVTSQTEKFRKAVIGKIAMVPFERVHSGIVYIEMKILDHKSAYGRDTFLVEPVSGKGRLWARDIKLPALA